MPAPVERVEERPCDARELRLVSIEIFDHPGDVGEQARPIELEVVRHEIEVGAAERQDLMQPVSQLDMAVSSRLRLTQGLEEGIMPDPVELAGDGFKTDFSHVHSPSAVLRGLSPPLTQLIGGVEPGVAAIGFRRAPIGREPRRPTDLPEPAETHRFDGGRG